MDRSKAYWRDMIWIILLGTLLLMVTTGWIYHRELNRINHQIERLKQEGSK